MSRVWFGLLGAALALSEARGATADSPDNADNPDNSEGLRLYANHQFGRALDSFKRALPASPEARRALIYLSIGRTQLLLGRPLEAFRALSKALDTPGNTLTSQERGDAQADLDELKAVLAQLIVVTAQPGARIRIDGEEVGSTPLPAPVLLQAGTHEIVAEPGTIPIRRVIQLNEGEHQTVHLVPEPDTGLLALHCPGAQAQVDGSERQAGGEAQRLPAGHHRVVFRSKAETWPPVDLNLVANTTVSVYCAPATPSPPPPPRVATRVPLGWLVTSAGVAVGGAALAHFFWNQSRYDDWRRLDTTLNTRWDSTTASDADQKKASIERARVVTVSLAASSGVLIAGGIVLLVAQPGRPETSAGARAKSKFSGLRVGGTGSSVGLAWNGTW